MLKRYRLVFVNVLLLTALGGSLYGKQIESAKIRETPFVSAQEIPFRDWKQKDLVIEPRDLKLLEPDDYITREYAPPDRDKNPNWVNLTVIAGHRKRTVHTPGYCMLGSGWDLITAQNSTLQVGDTKIPIARSVMAKEGGHILISFFFSDGRTHTPTLWRYQLRQLLKRFGPDIPLGALVRIITPAGMGKAADIKAAEALTAEFAQATLPKVLKSLRETKLERL